MRKTLLLSFFCISIAYSNTHAQEPIPLNIPNSPVAEETTNLACSSCLNHFGEVIKCEDFENLNLGSVTPQSNAWFLWPETDDDAVVSIEQAFESFIEVPTKSLKIEKESNSTPDLLYNISQNLLGEPVQLTFQMYVPTGKAAYFNIQPNLETVFPSGQLQVFFETNGSGRLIHRVGTSNQSIEAACFKYPKNRWFEVTQTFAQAGNSIVSTLVIDGLAIHQWNYGRTTIGWINFFATQNALFYVDKICLTRGPFCDLIGVYDRVCSNDIEFNRLCIDRYGITKFEFGSCRGVTNNICDSYTIPIQCGIPVQGNNYNSGNNFDLNLYDSQCAGNINTSANPFDGNDVIYSVDINGPADMTVSLTNLQNGIDLDVFIFQCEEEPTLLNQSDEISNCLINMEQLHPEDEDESFTIPNANGRYFIVVDGPNRCDFSSYRLSVDCEGIGPILPSLCDLGGTIIDQGIPYAIQINEQDTPLSLFDPAGMGCVSEIYDYPFPTDLRTQSFLYNHPGGFVQFNEVENEDVSIFIFDCSCTPIGDEVFFNDDDCPPDCLGQFPVSFEALPKGYYFILVVGEPGENLVVSSFPTDLCFDPTLISCNQEVESYNFGEAENIMDISTAYTDCYAAGVRRFEGPERLFQFDIFEQSFVTMTLDASEAMGMFLYNYNCGQECLNRALNPYFGGTAVLTAELSKGRYNLIVDKDVFGGDSNFTLNIECTPNSDYTDFYAVSDFDCPYNEDSRQVVSFQGLNNTYAPNDIISPGTTIGLFFQDQTGTEFISAAEKKWKEDNDDDEISMYIYQDLEGDETKCGFDLGEELTIQTSTPAGAGTSSPFTTTVGGIFNTEFYDYFIGDESISIVLDMNRVETSYLACGESTKTFEASGGEKLVTITADTDWQTPEQPQINWLGLAIIDNNSFNIVVEPNLSTDPRTGTVLVVSDSGLKCQYTIIQRGVCLPPRVDAGNDQVLTCKNSSVTLNALIDSQTPSIFLQWTNQSGQVIGNEKEQVISQPGIYTLFVRDDDGGCSSSDVVIITENLSPPVPNIIKEGVLGCGNSTARLIATGSTPSNLEYLWTARAGGRIISNPTLPEIFVDAPGEYELEVTRSDNGCSETETIILVENVDAPAVQINPIGILDCNSNSITLEGITSYSGNVSYQWTPIQGGNIISDPTQSSITINTPGVYELSIIRSDNNCSSSSTITIVSQTAAPSLQIEDYDMIDCRNQEVTLDARASAPSNINYSWTTVNGNITTNPNSSVIVVSTAGDYTLEITRSDNGCSTTETMTVQENRVPPTINISPPDVLSCQTNRVLIDASTSFPTDAIYTWISSSEGNIVSNPNSAVIFVDAQGTYTLEVTRSDNGCEETETVFVQEVLPPEGEISFLDSVQCNGHSDGAAILTAAGGQPAYIFSWPNGLQGAAQNNLAAGDWIVTISDQLGCTDEVLVRIGEPDALTVEFTTQHQGIAGVNDGAIDALISGGTPPYQYQWSNGVIDTSHISGLAPGTYTLTIIDDKGCSTQGEVTILPIECTGFNLVVDKTNVTCEGETTGKIGVAVDGAEGEVSFEWSGEDLLGSNLDGLAAGTYSLTVTDGIGCTAVTTIEILTFDDVPPTLSTQSVTLMLDEFGEAILSPDMVDAGSTDNCDISSRSLSRTNFDCDFLGQTSVIYTVTDISGNTSSVSVSITIEDQLPPKLECPDDVLSNSCTLDYTPPVAFDNCSGELEVNLLTPGFEPGETFLDGQMITEVVYAAQDQTGNLSQCSFMITLNNTITVQLDSIVNASEGNTDGEILISILGGTPPYSIQWLKDSQPMSSQEDLQEVENGLYQLIVKDSEGCEFSTSYMIDIVSNTLSKNIDENINIFPNPTEGTLYLEFSFIQPRVVELQVFDYTGKQIRNFPSRNFKHATQRLGLGQFPSGLYILKIWIDEQIISKKVVINK